MNFLTIVSGVIKKILTIFLIFLLSVAFLLSLQYYHTEIYHQEANQKFQGDYYYNPYKDYTSNTLKANFHAHSIAWSDLTNGAQTPQEIFSHYYNKGYDIISLSNYHSISKDSSASLYIPVYEHGYNIKKSHQLVINADNVSFFDFAAWQSYHNKQQVLKKLKGENNLIALAHPKYWDGYSVEDMKYLKGYDLLEVFNNYRTSTDIWDAALSSGYPAWIVSNDDCHDISKPELTFNNWTRISCKEKTLEGVIKSLKNGCHYGVKNLTHQEINSLNSCLVVGGEINVLFKTKAESISFISDNGVVKKVVSKDSVASYRISANDSYVRIEAKTGDETICLNPIIRYDGYQLSQNSGFPKVNILLTVFFRFILLFINSFILVLILFLARGGKFRRDRVQIKIPYFLTFRAKPKLNRV